MRNTILIFLLIAGLVTQAFSQVVWKNEGVDIIPDFTVTDINGDSHSLHDYTDDGYHVIYDFSATWCGICWNYHSTKVLEDYYQNHQNDAKVIFYENDRSTNNLTNSNFGDWTAGVSYVMCDDNSSNSAAENFMVQVGSFGYPRIMVVCSDNTYHRLSRSTTDPDDLRDVIEDKCMTTTSSKIEEVDNDYAFYQENEFVVIRVLNAEIHIMDYSITDANGNEVTRQQMVKNPQHFGPQRIDISGLASGLYVMSIGLDDKSYLEKFIVK